MKKLLALLLLISLSLGLLAGCNGIDNYYTVKVTGNKDSLMAPIKSRYQAGAKVEIKAYMVTDVSLHVFVNGKEIPMSHFDSDYWGFEFVMPEENVTIHLTYDRFYGKEEYGFTDLHALGFMKNETFKVSVKTTDYAEKYSLIETRHSSRQSDIDNFKAIANQSLIKIDNNIASNTKFGKEYIFYYNTKYNGEMSDVLDFNDAFFCWNDFSSWQAFKFKDENYALPTIENPDLITYSFKYDGRSSNVKRYDDESFSIDFFNIATVEFIPYQGASIETNSPFYLDSGYGKINLLNSSIFELDGEYYEIISGMNYWAYSYCKLGNN